MHAGGFGSDVCQEFGEPLVHVGQYATFDNRQQALSEADNSDCQALIHGVCAATNELVDRNVS